VGCGLGKRGGNLFAKNKTSHKSVAGAGGDGKSTSQTRQVKKVDHRVMAIKGRIGCTNNSLVYKTVYFELED